jgi:transcriptional regulator with XRE-family HTH domain
MPNPGVKKSLVILKENGGLMGAIADQLRVELTEPEFSEGYAESYLNSYIATQLKVLRQQRGLTQTKLADLLGTTQTVISRIENVNYSNWNIGTLKRLARAFELRLRVSFEEYGTLPGDVECFSEKALLRASRSKDPNLRHTVVALKAGAAAAAVIDIGDYLHSRQERHESQDPRSPELKKGAASAGCLDRQKEGRIANGTF